MSDQVVKVHTQITFRQLVSILINYRFNLPIIEIEWNMSLILNIRINLSSVLEL
jgi:hypothetical protein